MRALRLPVLLLALTAVARSADAVPIQAYGGWLDATFRVYDYGLQEIDGQNFLVPNVLRREFVLGVDYFPGVPLPHTQNGLDYEACINNTNPFLNACTGNAVPRVVGWDPGNGFAPSGTFGDPATQLALTDGCSPLSNPFSNDPVLIVARGNCTFAEKWASAENGGWGGVLVANAPGDPVAAVGLGPGTPDFVTPMLRVTADVAAEVRRGSAFPDGVGGGGVGIPFIYVHVTWSLTEPPQPVPEPSSLALLGIAIAGLAFSHRRKLH